MRSIIKAACLLGLMLVSVQAWASATLSWTPPTEREDGTPLDNLAGYVVHWGTAPGSYTQSATINDPAATGYFIESLASGTWYFAVQAFDATGLTSDYSAEVSKDVVSSPPLPPTGLTVLETARTAYTLVQSENRIALVPVGTVPAGTPCDSNQSVRDSNGIQGYVVPKAAVVWAGSVRAEVVVAECG